MLKGGGEEPGDWVVWYDASEITLRPDRSEAAQNAYDRLELNGDAYRRETGFDEDDAPDDEELRILILKAVAKDPTVYATAIKELTGEPVEPQAASPEKPAPEGTPPAEGEGQQGPPNTEGESPPPPNESVPSPARAASAVQNTIQELRDAVAAAKAQQGEAVHWGERDFAGWRIRHPLSCGAVPTRCPYDTADRPLTLPARSGLYRLSLKRYGGDDGKHLLVIGPMRQDTYADQRAQ
jgi:hypothetical protein